MSDPRPSAARPSKVTLASSLGGASCVVLIFSLFDTLSRLRTVEMRDQIGQTLAEPPFDTLATSTADVIAGMRVLAFVAGALAAAGAVLAVYVVRRHGGARVGFTLVAGLLLLTTPVAGVLTFLVAIAALLLWSQPARAWFAGQDPSGSQDPRRQESLMSTADRPPGESGSQPPQGGAEPPPWSPPVPPPPSPTADGATQPPPYPGTFGVAPSHPGDQPGDRPGDQPGGQVGYPPPGSQPQGYPYGQPHQQPSGQDPYQAYGPPYGGSPYGQHPGQGSGTRPGTVTAAVVLTIIGALGGLLMGLVLMGALSLDSGTLSDEVQRDPSFGRLDMDVDQVLALMWVLAVVLVLWCLAAIVLAVLAWRRHQWARWLLVGSASASALLSLLAILSIVSVVPLILSVATVVLLFTGGANAWFAGRDQQGPPSSPQWSSRPGPW